MERRAGDRGEVSAQVAVLAPVLFTLVFAVVHVSVLWTASQTASIAARRGARAASAQSTGSQYFLAAATSIESTVQELGARLAASPRVSRGATSVSVEVSVGFRSIVPFMPDTVTRSVTVPLEMYLRESDR